MILSFKIKFSKSQRVNEGVGEKRQVLVNNEGQMSQIGLICLFLAIGSRLRLEVDSEQGTVDSGFSRATHVLSWTDIRDCSRGDATT
jgi:hypothetical protein